MKLKKKGAHPHHFFAGKGETGIFFPSVTCIIGIGIGVLKLGWYMVESTPEKNVVKESDTIKK